MEGLIAGNLNHPNVVRCFTFAVTGNANASARRKRHHMELDSSVGSDSSSVQVIDSNPPSGFNSKDSETKRRISLEMAGMVPLQARQEASGPSRVWMLMELCSG